MSIIETFTVYVGDADMGVDRIMSPLEKSSVRRGMVLVIDVFDIALTEVFGMHEEIYVSVRLMDSLLCLRRRTPQNNLII